MTPSKMGKTKNLIFYSNFKLELVLFLHFFGRINLSKILFQQFTGIVWIIAHFMKINVSIQETKSSRGIRHSRKFVCVQTHHAIHGVHALHIQNYPCIIAEHTIYLLSCNEWKEFWPEPMKFLVHMPHHTHWLRMPFVK